jgi:hypothetical protein
VAKFYSNSAELGATVRFCSMDIRKDEEPVGTATGYLFSPNTEALGRVMHIKVRRIPEVDTHVDGVPDALAALIFLTSPPVTNDRLVIKFRTTFRIRVKTGSSQNFVLTTGSRLLAIIIRKTHTVHWLNRKQARVPLRVPDNRVHLREAATPEGR